MHQSWVQCTPLGQAFWADDKLYMAIVAACTVFRGADGYRLATEQLTHQIRVSGSERINLTSTLFHHPTRRHRACAMTSYLYRYSPICAVYALTGGTNRTINLTRTNVNDVYESASSDILNKQDSNLSNS